MISLPWWLLVLVLALDLYVIARAVSRGHGVEGTLAWIFAILALPFFGSLAYLALASPSIPRTAQRKRDRARMTARAAAHAARRAGTDPPEASLVRLVSQLTLMEPTDGNAIELLSEDQRAFADIEQALRSAKHSLWAESYIIKNDETGRRFFELATAKAREGLDVRVLYDAVGSMAIDKRLLRELSAAGGKVAAFLPFNPLRRRWSVHLRNHRKIIVVDGEVGYTGGMNIGDEYSGRLRKRLAKAVAGSLKESFKLVPAGTRAKAPPEPGVFKDTHLKLRGPAVGDLAQVFVDDWAFATEETLPLPPRPGPAPDACCSVAIVPSGPDQSHNANALAHFSGIAMAQKRVWLTSAYFVPDQATLTALISAALRGVDVRVLVPQRGDVHLVNAAARSYFPTLLRGGVRLFRYQPSVLHSKSMVVDSRWSLVGSANVDIRSFRLNFEVGALVIGETTAKRLERRFLDDLKLSNEVGQEFLDSYGFWPRLRDGAARLASPLL
ncbi:MAG: phospholipase D-like domain-containing protein [Planctomycetota bacterium]